MEYFFHAYVVFFHPLRQGKSVFDYPLKTICRVAGKYLPLNRFI